MTNFLRTIVPLSLLCACAVFGKAQGPQSWSVTTYRDATTGISFDYPAVLVQVDDVQDYFSPALTKITTPLTFHAKLAFLPPPAKRGDASDLSKLSFLYATAQTTSAISCRNLIALPEGRGTGSSRKLLVYGVAFTASQVSNAGMSHFLSGEVYTTFRGGTCFLFEEDTIGLNGVHGDLPATRRRMLENHLTAIIHTVRFGSPAESGIQENK